MQSILQQPTTSLLHRSSCLRPIGGLVKAIGLDEYKDCYNRMLQHAPGLERLYMNRPIGIALSGGPDSTALLSLTKQAFPNATIKAYMVDHGMNKYGVTEEPQAVQSYMKENGIDCQILQIDWSDSPLDTLTTGKRMVLTRHKRYSSLLNACVKDGVGLMLLGHNLDDDIVTMLYRMARFSGIDGVSGMKSLTTFPIVSPHSDAVLMGRPLLGVEKCRLLETCRLLDLKYTTDASNNSTEYTRNVILSTLSGLQASSPLLSTERLAAVLQSAKQHHVAIHDKIVDAMNESVFVNKRHGTAVVVANNQRSLNNRPVWLRILSYLFQFTAARTTPSRTASLSTIIDRLASCNQEQDTQARQKWRHQERLERALSINNSGFIPPALPSNKTGRIHMGMQVTGGCVMYPLARSDAALRIDAAKKESGRDTVEFGPGFLVQREKTKDIEECSIELAPNEYYLWDRRFWLSYTLPGSLTACGKIRFAIGPLKTDHAKQFNNACYRYGTLASKRALQSFQAVTPGHMFYNIPVITCKELDPVYMAMPCIDACVSSPHTPAIKWEVKHAGEMMLTSKFRCLP